MPQLIYRPNTVASAAGQVEILVWRDGNKFGTIKHGPDGFYCQFTEGDKSEPFPTIKDLQLQMEKDNA